MIPAADDGEFIAGGRMDSPSLVKTPAGILRDVSLRTDSLRRSGFQARQLLIVVARTDRGTIPHPAQNIPPGAPGALSCRSISGKRKHRASRKVCRSWLAVKSSMLARSIAWINLRNGRPGSSISRGSSPSSSSLWDECDVSGSSTLRSVAQCSERSHRSGPPGA